MCRAFHIVAHVKSTSETNQHLQFLVNPLMIWFGAHFWNNCVLSLPRWFKTYLWISDDIPSPCTLGWLGIWLQFCPKCPKVFLRWTASLPHSLYFKIYNYQYILQNFCLNISIHFVWYGNKWIETSLIYIVLHGCSVCYYWLCLTVLHVNILKHHIELTLILHFVWRRYSTNIGSFIE